MAHRGVLPRDGTKLDTLRKYMNESVKRLLKKAYPLYRPLLSGLGLLDYLARVHGTDKISHGYTKYYQHRFHPLRRKKLKLFEIGVGGSTLFPGGASLRMWKDYFPRGQIFALDIVDKSHLDESRIKVFQGDQNESACLNEIASRWGPFDIIIDDGSHVSAHIITSFKALFPHLTENGIYVIEDLLFSYYEPTGGSPVDLDNPRTSVGMLKTLIDDMHFKYIPDRQPQSYGDHILEIAFYPKICFIQKGDNTMRDAHGEGLVRRHQTLANA